MVTDFLAHLNATYPLNIQHGDLIGPSSLGAPPARPGDFAVASEPASIWHTAWFDDKSWHAVGFVPVRG